MKTLQRAWRIATRQQPLSLTADRSVLKFLDLSTGHLPNPDVFEGAAEMFVCFERPEGWFVVVPELADIGHIEQKGDVDRALVRIFRYAFERDCAYVLFDRDGFINPNLPRWEW